MSSSCSTAVSEGSRLDCWKTMPMRSRRRAAASSRLRVVVSTPALVTEPESGVTSVEATARRLDFPEPLGPVMAPTVPGSTVREALSTATMRSSPSGWVRVTSLSWITASPRSSAR